MLGFIGGKGDVLAEVEAEVLPLLEDWCHHILQLCIELRKVEQLRCECWSKGKTHFIEDFTTDKGTELPQQTVL